MSKPINFFLFACIGLLVGACGRSGAKGGGGADRGGRPQETPMVQLTKAAELPEAAPIEDLWAHERWIDKSARALRHGEGLSRGDDLAQLKALKREEVIAQFMNDPRFIDTVVDFNLFFLGFKDGDVRDGKGNFSKRLFDFPQALSSALALSQGKDYLRLFAFEQPQFVPPLEHARLPQPQGSDGTTAPPSAQLSQEEIRKILQAKILAAVDRMIDLVSKPDTTKEMFCALEQEGDEGAQALLSNLGLPDGLDNFIGTEWFLEGGLYCFLESESGGPQRLKGKLVGVREHLPEFFAFIERLSPDVYQPRDAADLLAVDQEKVGFKASTQLTGQGFWTPLPNSSTNYNRKRAAYVLKRFFCDDLTPVSIAVPEQHADDQHASSPACVSCHYKLDPMAGFFKDYGITGIEFSKSPLIIFDDLAKNDREKYNQAWKAPAGAARSWNIGFIRSIEQEDLNSYGESLSDLYAMIEKAPEAKQCLVKRAVEYFSGADQAFDAGFMTHLSETFIEESKTDSSNAFKRLVARILTSQTFSEPDPVSTQCYDYAPGDSQAGKPPCRVAFILQRNCETCHGSASAAGGLSLTAWTELADGTLSFPHVKGGRQLTKAETFKAISERLSTTDRRRSMPLDMFMTSADREALFLWVDHELASGEVKP